MIREGVLLALIPAVLGLFPLLTGHLEYTSRGSRMILDGAPARLVGLAAIAFGACLHVHFFWEQHETLSEYSQPALAVSGLIMLACLGYALYALLF